jgi:hypothetical protein
MYVANGLTHCLDFVTRPILCERPDWTDLQYGDAGRAAKFKGEEIVCQ